MQNIVLFYYKVWSFGAKLHPSRAGMIQAVKSVLDLEGKIDLNNLSVDGSCNSWAPFKCLEYLEEQSYKGHTVHEKIRERIQL